MHVCMRRVGRLFISRTGEGDVDEGERDVVGSCTGLQVVFHDEEKAQVDRPHSC